MKPQKFVAPTTRAALAKVREALGDDAVILSNRSTAEGVEVRALAEQEFEALERAVLGDPVAAPPARSVRASPQEAEGVATSSVQSALTPRPAGSDAARIGTVYPPSYWSSEPEAAKPFRFIDYVKNKWVAKGATQSGGVATEPPVQEEALDAVKVTSTAVQSAPVPKPKPLPSTSSAPAAATATATNAAPAAGNTSSTTQPPRATPAPILDELKALREFVAERFDSLALGDERGLQLVGAMLRRELLNVGFHPAIVAAVLESLPPEFTAPQARDWIEARLVRSLAGTSTAEDIIDAGGVFALTGATGVGKTTTAAKLAARCAVRYGADSVGLITTDTYRIGAPDQLRIYGKILGVPVHTVHDPERLQQTLETIADKRLVLIDTIGMSQRDERVNANLDMLDTCKVKRLLLLAASSQPETQEEVIDLYRGRTGAGTVLTKVDETVKLAPALGVLLRYRLRLRYVTNGQRVPEDLQLPHPANIVRVALQPKTRSAQSGAPERRHDAAAR